MLKDKEILKHIVSYTTMYILGLLTGIELKAIYDMVR